MSNVKVNIETTAEPLIKQLAKQSSKPLTNAAGDVRELTPADLAQFKPAQAVLPADWMTKHVRRGKQKAPTKVATTIRFDAAIACNCARGDPNTPTTTAAACAKL